MATTVGSHGVASFSNPSVGDALDPVIVKGNDNTLRSAYVDHDSDSGVHVQSSALASRPSAGTEGRKWITTDTGSVKLWYDNGASWEEVDYVPNSGTATLEALAVTNGATFDTNTLVVDATNNRVGVATTSPTVALDVTGAAKISNGLTVTSGSSSFGAAVGVTGTVTATTFSGSGASLTTLNADNLSSGTIPNGRFPATLPAASGVNLTALNATNVASGTLDAARLPTDLGTRTISNATAGSIALTVSKTGGSGGHCLELQAQSAADYAIKFDSDHGQSGADSPVSMASTAPGAYNNGSWLWIPCTVGTSFGWIPFLKADP